MIVLEGPDGAGKTTLLGLLRIATGLPIHERASSSEGGPVDNIYDWAKRDVDTWSQQPLSIYDRHPLISELIYGPIARDYLDPSFLTEEATHLFGKFYEKSLIILCLPPFDVLSKNVYKEAQMPGVLDNLPELYEEYTMLLKTIPLGADVVVYDYTSPGSSKKIIRAVDSHHINWSNKNGN